MVGDRVSTPAYGARHRVRFTRRRRPPARQMYPHDPRFAMVSDEARLVVSEPLGSLPGTWKELPESSYATVGHGPDELDVSA